MSSADAPSPVPSQPGPVTAPAGPARLDGQVSWTTILLRHSQALDKCSWERPDEDRPLSGVGRAQAIALADQVVNRLPEVAIGRVLSSPRLRCRQTVAPLAQRLGIPVEDCAVLDRDADPGELLRFVDGLAPPTAVLCTHGESLTGLLTQWRVLRGLLVPVSLNDADSSVTEKSAAWVVEREVEPLRARYLSPPELMTKCDIPTG